MTKKFFFTFLLLPALLFILLIHVTPSKADDLIIQDDGKIELVITGNGVLGVTTIPPQPSTTVEHVEDKQTTAHDSPSKSVPAVVEKTIPLVPSHTDSTVQINPPINNDKKVQVTITTQVAAPQTQPPTTSVKPPATTTTIVNAPHVSPPTANSPAKSSAAKSNSSVASTQPNIASTVMTKTVDKIVAQGSNGQPVITIKSDQAHELTIQQGSVKVTTLLPLNVDSVTHSLNVSSQNKSASINVLPTEAVQGIINKGILSSQNASDAKINLTNDTNGITYNVNTQKQGKLFGLFPVSSPVQVNLSAQNGKVVNVDQSLFFSIFGRFIK